MYRGLKVKFVKSDFKIYLFFSFLIVFIVFVSQINLDTTKQVDTKEYNNEIEIIFPKNSASFIENFIHVDNNWSYTDTNETWCYKVGNTYIIENVTIDANGASFGILINNSNNVKFIIRNCSVSNSGAGLLKGGIIIENSINGTLKNNTCFNNNQNGVLLINSKNITISDNIIRDNTQYGLYINDTDCQDNIIFNNRFIDNGINGNDNGTGNKWNNTIIGNYWSDYTHKDADDDNIGDTPYVNIDGSANSEDEMPIFWDPPKFSIISPSNYSLVGKQAIDYSITIEEGVGNYTWHEFIETGDMSTPLSLGGINELNNEPFDQILWDNIENGTITIRFYVNDSKGELTNKDLILRIDIIEPILNIDAPDDGTYHNSIFNVQASATDPNFDSVWYEYGGTKYLLTSTVAEPLNGGIWSGLAGEESFTIQ
ncbi:MAG: NosD domain-containing protein, partial [Promethearchaeota archaeon]